MSFVDGFFSFHLDITNTNVHTYAKSRIKVARHPDELATELPARVIAFCHCYSEDLEFSRGLFEPKEPTLWSKDLVGNPTQWIEVGCPDLKKIKTALRLDQLDTLRVYFFEPEQVLQFCQYLRGSKENWAKRIEFFLIEHKLLVNILEEMSTKTRLSFTFVDEEVYLSSADREYSGRVVSLDMWQEFQRSLESQP